MYVTIEMNTIELTRFFSTNSELGEKSENLHDILEP